MHRANTEQAGILHEALLLQALADDEAKSMRCLTGADMGILKLIGKPWQLATLSLHLRGIEALDLANICSKNLLHLGPPHTKTVGLHSRPFDPHSQIWVQHVRLRIR